VQGKDRKAAFILAKHLNEHFAGQQIFNNYCTPSLPLHWSPFSKLTSSLSFVHLLVPQKSTVIISGRRRRREAPKGYDNEHYQQQLFGKAVRLLNHVLHALLPPSSTASQRYNLTHRAHSRQLPEHSAQLSDSNFLIRMLYKNTY